MRVLIATTLVLLCLCACKQRPATEATEPQAAAPTPNGEKSFGFDGAQAVQNVATMPPLEAAELKTMIEALGLRSPRQRTAFPCSEVSLKNPAGEAIQVSNQFDLTKCLRSALKNRGKNLVSALLRYYAEFSCAGESLQRYEGLSFFDLSPTSCLTAGVARWRHQLEWQLHIKSDDNTMSTIRIAQTNQNSGGGLPCQAQRRGGVWVYEPCDYRTDTVSTTNNAETDAYNVSLFGTCTKRETATTGSAAFFSSGQCSLKINNWDVTLNFKGASSAPSWLAQQHGQLSQTDESIIEDPSFTSLRPVVMILLR